MDCFGIVSLPMTVKVLVIGRETKPSRKKFFIFEKYVISCKNKKIS